MARLNPIVTGAFLAAGVVAAVAWMPVSRWSFRNQVEALNTGFSSPTNSGEGLAVSFLRFDRSFWNVEDRRESLAMALSLHRRWTPNIWKEGQSHFERDHFVQFERHLKRFPDDVPAIAAYARLLTQAPMVMDARKIVEYSDGRLPRRNDERTIQRLTQVAQKLLSLADRGKKLDPGNLSFSLMRAMALNVLGRGSEARAEIRRGAAMTRFDDYAMDNGRTLIAAVEKRSGYRGEAFRTSVLASILMPHFASMKRVVRELLEDCPTSERPELRRALFHCQYTLAADADTLIGILVGRSGMAIALIHPDELRSSARDQTVRELEDRRIQRRKAEELAKLAPPDDPNELDEVAMFDNAEALVEATHRRVANPDFERILLFRQTAYASRFLVSLPGILIAALALWFWSKRAPEAYGRARGPLAIGLVGIAMSIAVLATAGGLAGYPLLLAFPFVLYAIVQAMGAGMKPVGWALLLAPLLLVIPMGLMNGLSVAGIGAALLGVAFFAARYSVVATTAALAAALVIVYNFRHPQIEHLGWLQVVPAIVLAGSVLLAAPARRVESASAALLIAAAAGFGFFTVRDLRENETLRAFNVRYEAETDRVRENAGVPRMSEL